MTVSHLALAARASGSLYYSDKITKNVRHGKIYFSAEDGGRKRHVFLASEMCWRLGSHVWMVEGYWRTEDG